MKALVLGSGGREQAIAWKIAKSPLVSEVIIAPGNAGAFPKTRNANLDINDADAVADFLTKESVELLVVGPEQPLVGGLVDQLQARPELSALHIVGPSREAAQMEGSKDFAKAFMQRHGIPTAKYRSFTAGEREQALDYIRNEEKAPYVLKADGLAAGKGVLICQTLEEAEEGLDSMLGGKFGHSADTILIETCLTGIECSVFVLTDGKSYRILPTAKDYKRIGEGDTGLNTGGMGAVSPVPFIDDEFMTKVKERIIEPTIRGLAEDEIDYRGFLYFGLMNQSGDPYVIEYNCRMGDPETQAVMPRIAGDLVPSLLALRDQTLADTEDPGEIEETALTVVAAMKGYPESYPKGAQVIIYGDDTDSSIVFHSGTTGSGRDIRSCGGRVFAVTALDRGIMRARKRAYDRMMMTCFDDMYYRHDIGKDLVEYE